MQKRNLLFCQRTKLKMQVLLETAVGKTKNGQRLPTKGYFLNCTSGWKNRLHMQMTVMQKK
jgi:hypothetical protein